MAATTPEGEEEVPEVEGVPEMGPGRTVPGPIT